MPSNKKRRSTTESRSTDTRKRACHAVPLNGLAWRPVTMPDRLDDVEGFYGLEEVDDVEVVRAQDSGKVEFRVPGGADAAGDHCDNESEWEGFSDTDAGATPAADTAAAAPEKPAKDTKLQRKNEKQRAQQKAKKAKKKKEQASEGDEAAANPFETLAEEPADNVDLPEWEPLNLALPTLQALSKLTFVKPTQIQSAAIPKITAGHDLIGKASTGSGKTLAFGIPILEAYLARQAALPSDSKEKEKESEDKTPIALILAPTRELAHQLHAHLTALARFAPDCNIVALTGGISLLKQQRQLKQRGGADILIATPGRLWEIVSEGQGWVDKLRHIKFLVVDEADRLLQEGHFKEVEEVLDLLSRKDDEAEESESESESEASDEEVKRPKKPKKPKKQPKAKAEETTRQTLVFSATFHQGLQQKLSAKGKKAWRGTGGGDLMDEEESMKYLLKKLRFREEKPQFVDVNPAGQLAEQLREGIIECGPMEKDLYLYYLLLRYPCRTLVFTNSISSVKRLAPFLSELRVPAHPLHSSMLQKARLRNLERFASPAQSNAVLVATDVAARGLDIANVSMVVHYHLPRSADMYVHRSGRTARADARGISVLLCAPEEVQGVRRLVFKVHSSSSSTGNSQELRGFDVDRALVARIRRRVVLARRIAESSLEKSRAGAEDAWLRAAADDLGVDYDSDGFRELNAKGKGAARGQRKKRQAAGVDKGELAGWRAELNSLLEKRVNAGGFSERYLTAKAGAGAGGVNLAHALLERGDMHDHILGVEKRNVIDEVAW